MTYKCIGCTQIKLNSGEAYCSYCCAGDKPGDEVSKKEKHVAEYMRMYNDGEDNLLEYYEKRFNEKFNHEKETDLSFVYRYASLEWEINNKPTN